MDRFKKVSSPTSISPCGCIGGSCSIYEKSWVQELLGESFHPGGIELTRRSISSLQLPRGAKVLDVASGTGAAARALADHGYQVVGVDASEQQVTAARESAKGRAEIRFEIATAESLPKDLGPFDGVFCECAFSLLQSQSDVSKSWIDALVPGGRLAISDMAVDGPLPDSLQGEIGSWACLGGARSVAEYTTILDEAGFINIEAVDEKDALLAAISELKRKLLVFGVGHLADITQDLGLASLSELHQALKDAARAAKDGTLSYIRLSATKPKAPEQPVARASARVPAKSKSHAG